MLIKEVDYYLNEENNFVFTEAHHLKRGHCCKNECKHCPWKYKKTNNREEKARKII